MPTPSVAVLQNQFRLSGRTKVACEVIHILNEMNIVPDVLTFTPSVIGQHTGDYFGLKGLRFNYVRVAPVPSKRGGLWQVLVMNLITRAWHSHYDLVFNSNNILQGLNSSTNYLHYIYYPFPVRGSNFDRFQRSSFWRFLYSRICAWILTHSSETLSDDIVYAISDFSRQAIARAYPELVGRIDLIYPPSFNGEVVHRADRLLRCVSVGSFSPDKNQLQQLAIVRRLPDLEFWAIGYARSKSYYRACKDYISNASLNNVRMETDAPYDTLQRVLRNSMFFLHTMEDEPFGMSTVEAIAAGCIPVVHDSGGQREIVPFEDLRFKTAKDGARVFRRLFEMNPKETTNLRQALQQHIQQFSRDVFRERMREILHKKLSCPSCTR